MARPPRSDEEKDRIRQRLCAGALQLYCKGGHEAVSFRNLAALLHMSHMVPYGYFADKEDLLAQVRLNALQSLDARIAEVDDAKLAPVERLARIARALVDFVSRRPDEFQLIFSPPQPALERYPRLLSLRETLLRRVEAAVQAGIDRGQFTGDARTITHIAWASAYGLLSLHTGNQLQHGRSLSDLVPLTMRMLFGPKTAKRRPRTPDAMRRAGS